MMTRPHHDPSRRLRALALLAGLTSCTGVEPALIGAAVNGADWRLPVQRAGVWIYEVAEFEA